ncbi:MAG TPA: FAD-dependent oxidoreductase [Thermoanaerobaculia bacterium]|nr:FAD-dependent oxidoreductase [Thermoanaerobaculia bacterium]
MNAAVVVVGAGIGGLSVAHELAVRRKIADVVVVDERPPLTLTSDKSTECYRNWWPGPEAVAAPMMALVDRSVDLLEELAGETDNAFALNRNGYAYLTARSDGARAFAEQAKATADLGGGALRVHGEGGGEPFPEPVYDRLPARDGPGGADLVTDPARILKRFPFLAPDVTAMLIPRRCGWLSAQQLGMILLERFREAGGRLVRGQVAGVEREGERVTGVRLNGGLDSIAASTVVLAAGPLLPPLLADLGVELPLVNELHGKVTFDDYLGVVPRHLPLMIWNDPVRLEWSDDERRELAADPDLSWLLEELPAGVHFRPEGGEGSSRLLLLWAFSTHAIKPATVPEIPPRFDDVYPQVVLRGVARMAPAMKAYLERGRKPFVDGGYYLKTPENRPLIGPLPVEGAYVLGALSGFGIMVSQGAAELLAAHLTGDTLPSHAPSFSPERFSDPAFLARLPELSGSAGEL